MIYIIVSILKSYHYRAFKFSGLKMLKVAISMRRARSYLVNPLFNSCKQSRLELLWNAPKKADQDSHSWTTQTSLAKVKALLMNLYATKTLSSFDRKYAPRKLAFDEVLLLNKIYFLWKRRRGMSCQSSKKSITCLSIFWGTNSLKFYKHRSMIFCALGLLTSTSSSQQSILRQEKPAPLTLF